MNEKLTNELINFSQALQSKLLELAPKAQELLLATYKVVALNHCISWLISLGLSLCLLFTAYKCATYLIKSSSNDADFYNELAPALAIIIGGISGVFGLLWLIFTLLAINIFYVIGLTHPEILLAHELLHKAGMIR